MGKNIGEESERIMASVIKKYLEAGSPDAYRRSVAEQKRKTFRYLARRNKVISANKIPIVSDLAARVKAAVNMRLRENEVGSVINAYGDLVKSSEHGEKVISSLKKRVR